MKMIVVACNTASSVALDELRYDFDVPIVGVIEPGARAAVAATRNGEIGVIGTTGTIASGAYQRAAATIHGVQRVHCAACPGFVEFVERGELDGDPVHVLAERLLEPLKEAGVDTLLLGCTHYPFLARTIADVMGRDVVLVSSAEETAFDVRAILEVDGAWSKDRLERDPPVPVVRRPGVVRHDGEPSAGAGARRGRVRRVRPVTRCTSDPARWPRRAAWCAAGTVVGKVASRGGRTGTKGDGD